MINLIFADDHKIVRDGLRKIFEATEDINVLADASNGVECLKLLEYCTPDIVLLDIDMPEMDGLKTLRSINLRLHNPVRPKVLMLTSHNEVDFMIKALDIGVDGYMSKNSGADELIQAIHSIIDGNIYIQPSLIPLLNSRRVTKDYDMSKLDLLTDRELQILKLVASGDFYKDVARKLNIKVQTVKIYLSKIYGKIGCYDKSQAMLFCIRNGIVTVQD